MSEPDRYTPVIGKALQGHDMAGVKLDKKGGYVTAEDYYNMREKLLGDLAKAGVKARKEMHPLVESLQNRIAELEARALELEGDCRAWSVRCYAAEFGAED